MKIDLEFKVAVAVFIGRQGLSLERIDDLVRGCWRLVLCIATIHRSTWVPELEVIAVAGVHRGFDFGENLRSLHFLELDRPRIGSCRDGCEVSKGLKIFDLCFDYALSGSGCG